MLQFQLFRIKVFYPDQLELLRGALTPPELLRMVIGDRPSSPLRGSVLWHIGNVDSLDPDGDYFRFGKMTKDSLPVIDTTTGDFVERELETAPYTHVVIDYPNEVCAIANNNYLAPETATVARSLARVLSASREAVSRNVEIEIGEVLDPQDFIAALRAAYAIKRFQVALTPPNPFDAHEQFQKPFERYLKATRASRGKTDVTGESLDAKVLAEVARSAGATGNDVLAWLLSRRGSRAEKKRMKGSSVFLRRDDVESAESRLELVVELRIRLAQVRSGREEN